MGRILFFLLLALAVYVGWRLLRAQQAPDREAPRSNAAETMVRCEVCGLNLPQSEALPAPGSQARWYCCEEHRRQAPPG